MESHVKSTCIYVENILGFFVSKITSTQLVINMRYETFNQYFINNNY